MICALVFQPNIAVRLSKYQTETSAFKTELPEIENVVFAVIIQ